MCDNLCALVSDGALFAKNSDRPVGERQLIEAHRRRAGIGNLHTTYLEIPDTGAYALVGSRPEWCWGFEHGVNEHRVAIGNEKIWTIDDPARVPPALIGMDLVRLGLERASAADEALDVMTGLLERHGQGGNGEAGGDPYWSSFLVTDPTAAWILETSGTTWAARAVADTAAISNRVTLSTDWDRASADVVPGADFDDWRDPSIPIAIGDRRLAVTRAALAVTNPAITPGDLASVLRDHGGPRWGSGVSTSPVVPPPQGPGEDFTGITVCMHLRDHQTTAAGMIARLPRDPSATMIVWVCVASPCVGVFVPTLPPVEVPEFLTRPSTWDRADRLRMLVEERPVVLESVRDILDPVEAELWAEADEAAIGSVAQRSRFVASLEERIDTAYGIVEDTMGISRSA